VARLEDVVIETIRSLAGSTVVGEIGRLDGFPGVRCHLESRPVKVAAVGVRTTRDTRGRRRTLHGIAINVSPDLEAFDAIVPCGITDRPVGSLQGLGVDVTVRVIEDEIGRRLDNVFGPDVTVAQVDRSAAETSTERPLLRRLRRAGVDPDGGLALSARKPEWLRIPPTWVRSSDHFRNSMTISVS
jgi:lipoate-protein ligase B